MVRTVPCESTATPSGDGRKPVTGRGGDQDGGNPARCSVRQPHHEVPVVRLGGDHERAAVDAEVAVGGIGETDLAAEIDVGARLDVEDVRRIRGVVRPDCRTASCVRCWG